MQSIKENLEVVQHLAPAVYKTNQTPNGVDLAGHYSAMAEISVAAVTDGTFAFELQESDVEGSGYAAVADADLIGTEPTGVTTGSGDSTVYRVGYMGNKRYLKVVVTVSGSPATGAGLSVNILKGRPRHAPVS